jgi:hypothetical protein
MFNEIGLLELCSQIKGERKNAIAVVGVVSLVQRLQWAHLFSAR